MTARLFIGFAIALSAVQVAACSVTTTTPDPYPDVQHFCTAVAQAECQLVDNCGVSGMTKADCETYRASECAKGSFVVPFPGSASALQRTYTSSKVKPCIDALTAAFKPDSSGANAISYDQLFGTGNLVDTCEAVFVGSAGNGATCVTNFDCTKTGEVCAPVLGQTNGQCATPTTKMLGDACADPGDECTSGTYCQPSATGLPKCVTAIPTGQACTSNSQCAAADHCAGGVCTALSTSGGPCSTNADCVSSAPFCDLYAGGKCEHGLGFTGGSYDCSGFLYGEGVSDGAAPVVEGGGSGDASATDAASGG